VDGSGSLPVLILHGGADKATKPSGVHDLLNDLGKEAVMADIKVWIEARLPRA
jgi:alpha-beta hydrolase superfamily lysophospholipase